MFSARNWCSLTHPFILLLNVSFSFFPINNTVGLEENTIVHICRFSETWTTTTVVSILVKLWSWKVESQMPGAAFKMHFEHQHLGASIVVNRKKRECSNKLSTNWIWFLNTVVWASLVIKKLTAKNGHSRNVLSSVN